MLQPLQADISKLALATFGVFGPPASHMMFEVYFCVLIKGIMGLTLIVSKVSAHAAMIS